MPISRQGCQQSETNLLVEVGILIAAKTLCKGIGK